RRPGLLEALVLPLSSARLRAKVHAADTARRVAARDRRETHREIASRAHPLGWLAFAEPSQWEGLSAVHVQQSFRRHPWDLLRCARSTRRSVAPHEPEDDQRCAALGRPATRRHRRAKALIGAGRGIRTLTPFRAADFESAESAVSPSRREGGAPRAMIA